MSEDKKKKPEAGKPFDGVGAVVEMFEKMDPEDRERLMSQVEGRDPKLASTLRERAFGFERLLEVDGKGIQHLMTAIPRPRWVMAMRKASDELAAHVYGNLSARAKEQFEEEMRELGPQRMSDVLAAQAQIAEMAKKLLDEGKIGFKKEKRP